MGNFQQIPVTAKALKDLVEAGKNLEEICAHFTDENGKSLPTATAKRYLKQCNLTVKKVRRPKFVLMKDEETANITTTEEVGANV